ncbi:MAG: aminotransferase class V-fold PLP-dependent enzyme [Eubacterium sp.]|nr:aminotransferase class V-fold PLP-dependent enzyme [Eubacterium sp.]
MIYLDNPATSMIKPPQVLDAMNRFTRTHSVNAGRGGHFVSIRGAVGIGETQEALAEFFGIENPERIAFTQNATYALNMAITGYLKRRDHVIITSMEHNSVLRPVHRLCSYTMVWANPQGEIDPKDVERAIRKNTKMIITTHASNVCGTVMPVYEIGKIAEKYGLVYLLDSAQTAGIIPIDVEKMGVSILCFSGHKGLMGPLGTGGLYVGENVRLSPLIVGGTGTQSKNKYQPEDMPDMLHSGTLNTPAIMALKTAVEYINSVGIENIERRERELAEYLISGLKNIPGVVVYGKESGNRNGTVCFNMGEMASGEVSDILDRNYRIATRGGYHCTYTAHQTLGSEKSGAVRVGFGAFSTRRDADSLLFAVNRIAKNGK